jgi:hypothetical protein
MCNFVSLSTERHLLKLIWDRHNLFKGRSPIILRGRREKGMYFFSQVLFNYFFFNYLAGVISLWLFNWRLKVCLFAKKKSYKIFRSFKRSYIDRNIPYYNKNKIQIQMFVLFPNIFETKQYVTYPSNRLWCHFFNYSHNKTTRKYRK